MGVINKRPHSTQNEKPKSIGVIIPQFVVKYTHTRTHIYMLTTRRFMDLLNKKLIKLKTTISVSTI